MGSSQGATCPQPLTHTSGTSERPLHREGHEPPLLVPSQPAPLRSDEVIRNSSLQTGAEWEVGIPLALARLKLDEWGGGVGPGEISW